MKTNLPSLEALVKYPTDFRYVRQALEQLLLPTNKRDEQKLLEGRSRLIGLLGCNAMSDEETLYVHVAGRLLESQWNDVPVLRFHQLLRGLLADLAKY